MRSMGMNLAKCGICAGAGWWALRNVSLSAFTGSWQAADPVLLAAAAGIFLLTPILQGVRLRRLLAVEGMSLGLSESVHLAFAGNFVNFAVPLGSTTGDVYKAAVLGRTTRRTAEAAAVTMVDRAIGFGTLLISVTLLVVAGGPGSPLAPLRGALIGGSAGALAAATFLALSPAEGWPLAGRFLAAKGHSGRLRAARAALERGLASARRVLRRPDALAMAVLDTLGIQVAATASFLLAAVALGFEIPVGEYGRLYAFFSAGEMVKAMPGPPQGMGTLEAAYGVFFRGWASPAAIVSAAVAIRGINLVCSLPGAPLAVRHLRSSTVAEIEAKKPVAAHPHVLSPVAGPSRAALRAPAMDPGPLGEARIPLFVAAGRTFERTSTAEALVHSITVAGSHRR